MGDPSKPHWYRDPKIRALIIQAVVLTIVVGGLLLIFSNVVNNLEKRGIQTGFSFLFEVAPFKVGFSPFLDFELGKSTYWDVFFIGILNTILVGALGIIAATMLGFIIGVARLSDNWLVAKFAAVYIETFRNIPLLLQIMFWHFVVFLKILPMTRQSWPLNDMIFLHNRGLQFPWPSVNDFSSLTILLLAMGAAFVAVFFLLRRAKRRRDTTGQETPILILSVAIIVGVPALVLLFTGSPLSWEFPIFKTFNFKGGAELPLPLFSLWFALTVYTAAFIAENVRGGIAAVSRGQIEAARAVGLRTNHILRFVIIPQAMRVIIPPTISQYLNLFKNSSLAIAISYEELFNIFAGISLNQTGQAVIIIAMTIAVYETISLLISAFMNWYNKKIQIVER